MLPVLLLSLSAFAQDDTATDTGVEDTGHTITLTEGTALVFPEAPPSLAAGITKVPFGSLLLVRQEDGTFTAMTVPGKSWLMPDDYFAEAITKAKQLEIAEPALERCTERALAWQSRTYDALDTCSNQFGSDEALVNDLTGQVRTLETRAIVAEDKVRRSRNAAAIAWSITGGILLGGVVVTAVAVGG